MTGAKPGGDVEVPLDIADDIDERVMRMRRRARDAGGQLAAPVLAMGVFERVGSNWFTSRLQPGVAVYNEPFRQQLHTSHPLSSTNPEPSRNEGFWDESATRGLAAHWLTAFAVSKYDTGPVVIKETNLYFSTGALLRLFPDSDIVLLSRNLVGIVNSFQRADLFTRWRYEDRYRQVAQTAASTPAGQSWTDLVPQRAMSRTEMVVRLVVLNTALLVQATASRRRLHLPYEEAVISPAASHAKLQAFAPALIGSSPGPGARRSKPDLSQDATFSPHESRTSLSVSLWAGEVQQIETMLAATLESCTPMVDSEQLSCLRDLLSGTAHGHYKPSPESVTSRPFERRHPIGSMAGKRPPAPGPRPRFVLASTASNADNADNAASYLPVRVSWRNQLVTNQEFCTFLNAVRCAGAYNVVGGVHLLFNESMISGRGGRVIPCQPACDDTAQEGAYRVVPGYENHAASWVTWLGAALFARHSGARLPTRSEFLNLVTYAPPRTERLNVDFRFGDTTPVLEHGADTTRVHHVLGNVQIWCEDGPPDGPLPSLVTRRYYCGAAWNTPGDDADATRPKARHITGSSRSIGIRLVRDTTTPTTSLPIDTIAGRLTSGLAAISGFGRDLRAADEELVHLAYEAAT